MNLPGMAPYIGQKDERDRMQSYALQQLLDATAKLTPTDKPHCAAEGEKIKTGVSPYGQARMVIQDAYVPVAGSAERCALLSALSKLRAQYRTMNSNRRAQDRRRHRQAARGRAVTLAVSSETVVEKRH